MAAVLAGSAAGHWPAGGAALVAQMLQLPRRAAPEVAQHGLEDASALPKVAVDYIMTEAWVVHDRMARAREFAPPEVDDRRVVRLLTPRRHEDTHFLQHLSTEHLRVDLWPHRSPEPHVHVRISTDAIVFPHPAPQSQWPGRWFAPRKQWLLLFEAVVHLPRGIALLGCIPTWRWAQFNFTDTGMVTEIGPPFRVLEVSCPRRPRGFLSPPLPVAPEGPRTHRDVVLAFFRLAFLVMLVAACVLQIVLLLICVVMLLVQVRRGRPHGM